MLYASQGKYNGASNKAPNRTLQHVTIILPYNVEHFEVIAHLTLISQAIIAWHPLRGNIPTTDMQ
jgi:hypothetical protein